MKPLSELLTDLLKVIPAQANGQHADKPLSALRHSLEKKLNSVSFLELPEDRQEDAVIIQRMLSSYDIDGSQKWHLKVKAVWDKFWDISPKKTA